MTLSDGAAWFAAFVAFWALYRTHIQNRRVNKQAAGAQQHAEELRRLEAERIRNDLRVTIMRSLSRWSELEFGLDLLMDNSPRARRVYAPSLKHVREYISKEEAFLNRLKEMPPTPTEIEVLRGEYEEASIVAQEYREAVERHLEEMVQRRKASPGEVGPDVCQIVEQSSRGDSSKAADGLTGTPHS